jgi:hypothetical protein
MQAVKLSPSAGWHWIYAGWYLFRQQPMALFSWAMFVTLLLIVGTIAAPIGPLLFIALMPSITYVTLCISREVHAGRQLGPRQWLEPLRQPGLFKKLFMLGLLYVAICLGVGFFVFLPFTGELSTAMQTLAESQDVAPLIEAVRKPLILFAVLYFILAALFWYSPVLIGWHKTSITQSLFFSAIACWRNKFAFLVYGIAWAAIFYLVDFVMGALVSLGISVDFAATLQVPINIAIGSILYASFYPTYVSVFGQPIETVES